MKKNYFMLVCLVLISAFSATAQVTSVADLFGKYRFTADVEFTEDGQSYKDLLSGDCDATIEEDGTYIAKIVGFAGSQVQQNINAISIEKNMVKVLNLNNPALWNNGLMLANENGDNPYGVWNSETSNWDVESYGPVYYTFDPATKEISIPAFTVITMSDYNAAKGTIIAKYTNVKMTLVEAETIEVADISGDWNFAAGSGAYDTMEGSVIPTDFSIALTKSGDDNLAYTATIAIEGYNNIELPATFDGNILALAYDNTYLDEAKGIRFAPMYGPAQKGTIEFKSQSESAFTLYSGFSFASDKMGKTKDETADSLIVNGEYHQWYIAGTLKSANGGSQAFTWDGTWNVKVGNPETDIIKAGAEDISSWPAEFPMHITYYEAIGMYYVDQLFGYDLYGVNQGGLKLTPNADGTATVALDGYYGCAFLKSNGDGTFLQLTNSSGSATNFTLTLNDDGSVKIEDLFIQTLDFGTGAQTPLVFYQNMTAAKEGAEEPAFDWAGDYKFNAGAVDVYYQGVEFPAEFDVNIAYFDGSQYGLDSYYYISSFMGKQLGQSVIRLNIAEDNNSAEMVVGGLCGAIVPGELYYKIYDMNATTSPVKMTLNDDGTISIANFFIKVLNYNDNSEVAGAYYKNSVLYAPGSEPEEPAGLQYRIKCDAGYLNIGNTEDHPTGPVGGVNVVEYADDNNQIFTIEESGDGNVYLKSASGYYIYCHQWNVDGKESEKTALTFEEVGENKFYIKQAGGYFKVENVGGVNYPFCDAAISAAAVWSLEEVGSTSIENVKGENGNVEGIYDLSGRKFEQVTAPGLYIINGKKVLVK
ncbi:MAG: hypothetical protein IKJ71_03485 [Bacteroidaceae bacterium]|nr:hypothetical protein [Bacteroidaceae bacterium]